MATMDFSPMIQALIMISALANQVAFALTIAQIMVTTFEVSKWSAGIGAAAALIAMTALSIGTYVAVKDTFKSESLGPQYKDLQEGYAVADTGMFVGSRRSVYDEGGIAPRHQLVYVEPGEQIISKTQGMVGMGSGVNVYVGDVYTQDGTDFADKLADALPRAMQRASYRGTF